MHYFQRMNPFSVLSSSVAALLGGVLATAAPSLAHAQTPVAIRVVNCDQKVASAKRGVCANELSADDFKLLVPGVSWFYNWHYESKDLPPAGTNMEFIPMAWGERQAALDGLQSYLARTAKKPRVVLAINEPNLRGQAFITPEHTADFYRKVQAIDDRYGIPTVGPHMALGSGVGESIKAPDPIQNKEVTYTFMVPFLDAFLHYLGNDAARVPATAVHSYGNLGELKWAVKMLHEKYNRPVWVTEFAQWKSDGPDHAREYALQATDFLERTPYVAGYAWFKERVKNNPGISLLEDNTSQLTPTGETYVNVPPHDPALYYRVPGRLQAEAYAAMNEEEIRPTSDTDGFAYMESEKDGGWLDLNVQVDVPGAYTLKFRAGGKAANFSVNKGVTSLGQAATQPQPGWQTLEMPVQLAAGPQTLRVTCEKTAQALNWIEFTRR